MATYDAAGLKPSQALLKRLFDISLSLLGLALTWWIILLAYILATIETGANGIFIQERVGRHGNLFRIFKIRTMKKNTDCSSTVTTSGDSRITPLGRVFRKTKIDELPQLINVLLGEMSFVGPRPDVQGYADLLEGEDRIILTIRPGITGPATLKYCDEEHLLEGHPDPEVFNREVIFPDKTRINREYVQNYTFRRDLKYIVKTFFKSL